MPTTFKDYYATLGVPRTASDKEIRAAFRKLARKHHPDVNAGDKSAEQRFKEVNEANEVLSDPEKRRKYDELGPRWQEYEQWERAGRPGPNPFGGGGDFEYRTASPDQLEDLFGDRAPFSDFFQTFFGQRRSTRQQSRRGQDVVGEAEITLDEAYRGTGRTIELNTGAGVRRVELRIPAGIHDGARVRAAGQGAAGGGGGAPGDLYVQVRIQPHPVFSRHGRELRIAVAVPLAVAIAGGTVPVPTLRGTTAQLAVPAGTQNGARLRLRGLGMPHVRSDGAGDLIATVDVRLPVPVPEDLMRWAEGARPS